MNYWLWLLLLLIRIPVYSQGLSPLQVTAEFAGSGEYHCIADLNGYYTRLAVKNTTTTTRRMFIYSCSWYDNWSTNKKAAYIYGIGCSKNIPEEIELLPGQQLVFYAFTAINQKSVEKDFVDVTGKFTDRIYEVRFCFLEIDSMQDFQNTEALLNHAIGKIYWSEPVSLRIPSNSHEVIPLPTK